MANVILKLVPNKWDNKYLFSFIKKNKNCPKDQHFLAHNSFKCEIKPGEFWECFIWHKREIKDRILYKVVPYKKIHEKHLKKEEDRVGRFNRELAFLERFIGKDFEKIVFRTNNIPFLLAKSRNEKELSRKYPDYAFLKDKEGILARPCSKERYMRH